MLPCSTNGVVEIITYMMAEQSMKLSRLPGSAILSPEDQSQSSVLTLRVCPMLTGGRIRYQTYIRPLVVTPRPAKSAQAHAHSPEEHFALPHRAQLTRRRPLITPGGRSLVHRRAKSA